jgi:hypothetical protein
MKNPTKRFYPAFALLALGCFTLWGAVQAEPTPLAKPSPTPSPTQNVSVVNPTTSPVPVRDVDNAARQPFEAAFICYFAGSTFCQNTGITVPSGKQLVIEFVSIEISTETTLKAKRLIMSTTSFGSVAHYFPLSLTDDDGFHALFAGAHQTRLYFNPSTTMRVECEVSAASSSGECFGSVSGYLVDVP